MIDSEKGIFMYLCDMHTHTIASGHGTSCTITDMAKKAFEKDLTLLGITDHGPATRGAGTPSYFRSLAYAPRMRCGIRVCYGVEANICDFKGTLDLSDELLSRLDYAIASMHEVVLRPGSISDNTQAYIQAMKHPAVRMIGHCDDVKYPVDYRELTDAAREYGIIMEVNNASLAPDGYRGDTYANNLHLLEGCIHNRVPVLLSSDSHGTEHIGDFAYADALLRDIHFPEALLLNSRPEHVLSLLHSASAAKRSCNA